MKSFEFRKPVSREKQGRVAGVVAVDAAGRQLQDAGGQRKKTSTVDQQTFASTWLECAARPP